MLLMRTGPTIIADAFITSKTRTERTVHSETDPLSKAGPVCPRAVLWVLVTEELLYIVDLSIFPTSSEPMLITPRINQ